MGRYRPHAVTSRADFQRIFGEGRVVRAAHVIAHALHVGPGVSGRMAIVVSRKHGGAVLRNRIRRRIREAVRLEGGPPAGWDTVFVARPGASELSQIAWKREINQIMEGIWRSQGARC